MWAKKSSIRFNTCMFQWNLNTCIQRNCFYRCWIKTCAKIWIKIPPLCTTTKNRSTLHPPPPRNCHELANPGHSKQICETNVEILVDPWRWRKTWVKARGVWERVESMVKKTVGWYYIDLIESICCNPLKGRVEGYDTRIPKHCTIYFPFLGVQYLHVQLVLFILKWRY